MYSHHENLGFRIHLHHVVRFQYQNGILYQQTKAFGIFELYGKGVYMSKLHGIFVILRNSRTTSNAEVTRPYAMERFVHTVHIVLYYMY